MLVLRQQNPVDRPSRWSRQVCGRNHRPPGERSRPGLDVLEGRALLRTVTSLLDNGMMPGTLRYEIAYAFSGETIKFQHGLTETIELSEGQLVIDKSLIIQGPGADQLTVSGQHSSRVFSVVAGDVSVTLAGLTIAEGAAIQGGGIFEGGGATLTVIDCTISGNRVHGGPGEAGKGAGIYADSGATLTVDQCTLIDNEARGGGPRPDGSGGLGEGGGLFLVTGTSANVRNSLFTNNRAIGGPGSFGGHSGGAAINNHGRLSVSQCVISGNVSIGGAGALGGFATSGGIINENSPFSGGNETGASLHRTSSSITANLAVGGAGWLVAGSSFGAGITNFVADLVVADSQITHNSALVGPGSFGFSLAGGILSFGGTVCITGSKLEKNRAAVHPFDDMLILSQVVC